MKRFTKNINHLNTHQLSSTLLVIILFIFSGCKDDEVSPTDSFVKVYNNELFNVIYEPLDVKQNEDGGFIVLGRSNENATYLLRTDESGNHVADTLIETPYTNPLSELFKVGSDYYFFCMDNVSFSTYVLRVNESDSNQVPEVVTSLPSIVYPLHASQTPDGGYIVQSYNRESRSTVLTRLNSSFGETWQSEYEVLEDVEESIIAKFAGTADRDLPFFTGSTEDGNTFFFNGFYNFSLSMVFVSASNGDYIGTLNGLREETGISAAVHIQGEEYGIARFSFDQNYILPKGAISPQSNTFSGEIGGNEFPEIEAKSKVIAKRLQIGTKNVTIFGTETKGKQIALYFYDEADGSFLNARYFGNTNPYSIGNFSLTDDGGLVVTGQTHVAGRFPRIALFKISVDELINLTE